MDLCGENFEGFLLEYYHFELEKVVIVYVTGKGKVVSIGSVSV